MTNERQPCASTVLDMAPVTDHPVKVAVVAWPDGAAIRDALSASGEPRLLVVAEGSRAPELLDCLEDWVHAPAREEEVRARMEALALRARAHHIFVPAVDDDGRLHFGAGWVQLPPVEARLAAVLAERFGRLVGPTALMRSGWPDGTSVRSTLDVRIHRLRRRIGPLGLVIRTVRRRGWVLESETGGSGATVDGCCSEPEISLP